MPRDGSEIYYIPPGTEGIPDSTIESIKYNEFIHDVEQDLNHPRPIVAGGTGGSTEEEALFNLSGEMAYQVVTNFDTHPYIPGSFYADAAATAPPVAGHAFAGIIYQANLAGDMVVEARDLTTGVNYIRIHSGGVWGTWGVDNTSQFVKKSGDVMTGLLTLSGGPTADLHAATKKYVDDLPPVIISPAPPTGVEPGTLWWESETGLLYVLYDDGNSIQWVIASPQPDTAVFVMKNGDTMTGDLTISKATPSFNLDKPSPGTNAAFYGTVGGLKRWGFILTDTQAESGGNSGSGFGIYRYNDAGAFIDGVLVGLRDTGLLTVKADPIAALGVATKQYVDGKAPAAATAAEYVSNSAPTKMLTPGAVWGVGWANLGTAASYAPNLSASNDFIGFPNSAFTLANPTNAKAGQKGIIIFSQDATGGRTITFGTAYKFPGGIKPTLSTTPNALDVISYVVLDTTPQLFCTFSAGFA